MEKYKLHGDSFINAKKPTPKYEKNENSDMFCLPEFLTLEPRISS